MSALEHFKPSRENLTLTAVICLFFYFLILPAMFLIMQYVAGWEPISTSGARQGGALIGFSVPVIGFYLAACTGLALLDRRSP